MYKRLAISQLYYNREIVERVSSVRPKTVEGGCALKDKFNEH